MLTLLLSALLGAQTLAAMMEVRVPELPVVALHGADATLDCSFGGGGGASAPVNLSQLSVFWQLTDTKRSVHGYREGREQLADQAGRFANRTALRAGPLLAGGDASLTLRRVEVADEGSYTCFVSVEQNYSSASLLLLVAAAYTKPAVTLEPASNNVRPGEQVALTCESHGGFPEATVLWREEVGGGALGEGPRNLTHNVSTSLVANERGLFSVRSVLTLQALEPDTTYSCLLTNPLLGEEGLASVTITGPLNKNGTLTRL